MVSHTDPLGDRTASTSSEVLNRTGSDQFLASRDEFTPLRSGSPEQIADT